MRTHKPAKSCRDMRTRAIATVAGLMTLIAPLAPALAEPVAPDLPAQAPMDASAKKSAEAIATERASAEARDRAEDDVMRDDHPAIRPLIAANPGQDLVICLAGCAVDAPSIIQMRQHLSPAVQTSPRAEPMPTGLKPVTSGAAADHPTPVASAQH